MKNVTDSFLKALGSFEADFRIAQDGRHTLSELDRLLNEKDKKLINDINLLSELCIGLRSGKFRIVDLKNGGQTDGHQN